MNNFFLLFRMILLTLPLLGNAITFGQSRILEVSPEGPLQSLSAAIEQAEAGDHILVKGGVYREAPLTVDKALHLQGVDRPVLEGTEAGDILLITASGVEVEGFQFQNVPTSYTDDLAAIRVKRVRDFRIHDNRLINTFFGIYLEHAYDGEVADNYIEGRAEEEMSSGNAIHLWYCKRIEVCNNTVRRHRDGIYFEFVDHSVIEHNLSEDNLRYGLHFMFSNDDSYAHNTFRRNGAGVAVMFSRRIEMTHNRFEHNWGGSAYGLLLKEIYDAQITDNLFEENTVGIFVEGSNRIEYYRNELRRNGWAVKISGGCFDNKINHNNFIGNTFDLAVHRSNDTNSFDGNYWSDYSGYDLDRDGRGDVPYRPVKLFNYVVNQTPEAMVLLRSVFVDLINFSEKVSPVFTPDNVRDEQPFMDKLSF